MGSKKWRKKETTSEQLRLQNICFIDVLTAQTFFNYPANGMSTVSFSSGIATQVLTVNTVNAIH